LHASTDQKKTHQLEIASIPPVPTSRIMVPELRRLNQRIRPTSRKMSGGATRIIQGAYSAPCRAVDVEAELIIMAIVPGPAVEGIANGTKAIPVSAVSASEPGETGLSGLREQHTKANESDNQSPAIRSPGIEIPNVFITNCPA
jgi:hypothetical protein